MANFSLFLGYRFRVSVLGQSFSEIPECFDAAKRELEDEIINWGYLPDKDSYWRVLASAHVAVSTANHEFFGVSMVEAAMSGCFPLVPNRLSYPEIFPKECIYATDQQLFKRLRSLCKNLKLAQNLSNVVEKFAKSRLEDQYKRLLSAE